MFCDQGLGNILDDLKKTFTGGVGAEILTSDTSRDLLREKLAAADAGKRLGTEIGCGIASAFDSAVPQALWGGAPDMAACPKPVESEIKIHERQNPYMVFVKDVTSPTLAQAQRVASQIAKPRIEARLTPWFVGLPIAGLLVGVGVTYLVMNRTRPKR